MSLYGAASKLAFARPKSFMAKARVIMRELSHAVLKKHAKVKNFQLGGAENSQNWGKTSFVLID